mgnify:FL=1
MVNRHHVDFVYNLSLACVVDTIATNCVWVKHVIRTIKLTLAHNLMIASIMHIKVFLYADNMLPIV